MIYKWGKEEFFVLTAVKNSMMFYGSDNVLKKKVNTTKKMQFSPEPRTLEAEVQKYATGQPLMV